MAFGDSTPIESNISVARSKVSGPSIGLMIVGGIGIAFGLLGACNAIFSEPPVIPPNLQQDPDALRAMKTIQALSGPIGITMGLLQIVVGGLIVFGAIMMKDLKYRPLAIAASILAIVPCVSLCCIIGLPFGVWSIVVLYSPEVKAAFR